MTAENGKIDAGSAHTDARENAIPLPTTWTQNRDAPHADICIVGLGPGPVDSMTLAAWRALVSAPRLVLRTARHPGVAALPPDLHYATFDALYEQHATFAAVYAEIVERIVALGQEPGGVVYAVPGHPWVGEATTPRIWEAAAAAGLTCTVVDGISFVEPCFAAVGVDLMDGSQVLDAMLLAQQHHPKLDPGLPLLVAQIYSRAVASEAKLTLLNAYPPTHPVQLLQAAGHAAHLGQTVIQSVPLAELDHHTAFDHMTSLYVPPLPAGNSYSHLQEIVAHLRAPEGCPWDREQTLDSLKQDLLGECVEVLEAIDKESDGTELDGTESNNTDNSAHIAEELGDLLLVATMMVQIATEEGRFQLGNVTQGIVDKLIRRHPHVFGSTGSATTGPATTGADNVDQIVANWDAIKAAEKAAKGEPVAGPLDGVPVHLPALEKARVLQSKAEKAGLLQRAELAQAIPALETWLQQWEQAHPNADAVAAVGELLWTLVALAHSRGVNAEDALRGHAVAFRAAAQVDT